MPIPGSLDAPHFDGTNLREFFINYEAAADGSHWDDARKCSRLPRYCSPRVADLLETLPEIHGEDWEALKAKIKEYYHESRKPRYTRQDLEAFVNMSPLRAIGTRKQFIEYNREFQLRVEYIRPEGALSEAEKNLYFWQGLPDALKRDVFLEMKTNNPHMSLTEAQPVATVTAATLKVLNRDSL
ncbi:hypothetical protein DL93DRAFT_2042275, partial [Clavulina sp. PMI_390]